MVPQWSSVRLVLGQSGHACGAVCAAPGWASSVSIWERTQSVDHAQPRLPFPAGASIIWSKNYLMADLAQAAGLEREDLGGDDLLAVYDGQILVFEVWNMGLSWGVDAQLRAADGNGVGLQRCWEWVGLQRCCDVCHRAQATPHQCCLLHPSTTWGGTGVFLELAHTHPPAPALLVLLLGVSHRARRRVRQVPGYAAAAAMPQHAVLVITAGHPLLG